MLSTAYWHQVGGNRVKMGDGPKKISVNAAVLTAVFGCLWLGSMSHSDAKESGREWVGTWATAPMKAAHSPQAGTAPDFAGCTLRQIVHVSVGGKAIRVKLSNAFGKTPLKG